MRFRQIAGSQRALLSDLIKAGIAEAGKVRAHAMLDIGGLDMDARPSERAPAQQRSAGEASVQYFQIRVS
jgi:hypothetical protein